MSGYFTLQTGKLVLILLNLWMQINTYDMGLSILLLLLLSCFSRVRLYATPQMAAHQGPRPWDSPGKNIGVGCHFLLQCMKVKSESEVAQSCLTLSDPMDRSLPGSSIHGIFQARVLEWGAIAFSGVYIVLLKLGAIKLFTRTNCIISYLERTFIFENEYDFTLQVALFNVIQML